MKIFRSAFLVSSLLMIARILGFVRDSLIARFAGVGMFSDIFFSSFKIANFFRKILSEGSFFAAFVPSFSKILHERGKLGISVFGSKVFSAMVYISVIITIICEIFMEKIVSLTSPGFLSDNIKFFLTVEISRILFFYFILVVCSSVLCGLLNSAQKFSYYATVPMFLNIGLIIFIIFFRNSFKTFAHALTYGVLAGGVMQFAFAYIGCVIEGFKIRFFAPSKKILNVEVIRTFKKMIPATVSGGLSQINTLIDSILGSLISHGISYLYFTERIFFLPSSLIGTALGVVSLPALSRAINKKNEEEVVKIQTQSLSIASILVFPATFALIFCGEIFVSILFERGLFVRTDAVIVGHCIKILALCLPFVIYSKIFSSTFFSSGNTKIPMLITLFCAVLNAFLAFLLLPFIGIYGIVLSSAVSHIFEACTSFLILKKRGLINLNWREVSIFNLKVLIASAAFGFICFFLFYINQSTSYYLNIFEFAIWKKLLYAAAIGLVGLVVYLILLLTFKVNIKRILAN